MCKFGLGYVGYASIAVNLKAVAVVMFCSFHAKNVFEPVCPILTVACISCNRLALGKLGYQKGLVSPDSAPACQPALCSTMPDALNLTKFQRVSRTALTRPCEIPCERALGGRPALHGLQPAGMLSRHDQAATSSGRARA